MSTDQELKQAIIELWHISRVALITTPINRHHRMLYVAAMLRRNHPELIKGFSSKRLWFTIEETIDHKIIS